MEDSKRIIANTLFYKLINQTHLDQAGKIKENLKHNITIPELNIHNSKFIGKPEDKFETMLYLPPNPKRIAEGGLRTKGLFKFSYKKVGNYWYICDLEGNPAILAPKELQEKINNYLRHNSALDTTSELPLITVITVVYNGAKTLEQTIQSVINQTYPNVEYIIIDGGSTDGTLDIIKKYEDQIDYWVSEPDKGIYDAMDKGIILSMGELVGIINSDDWYEKGIFVDIIQEYIKSDKKTIFYGNVNIIKDNIIYFVSRPPKKLSSIKRNMLISHPTVFVPKEIYRQLGFYSTDYKICSDWDFLLRCYMKNVKFQYIDKVISNFRIGGTSYVYNKYSIYERHLVRKNNRAYKFFDRHYLYDRIKLLVFGKHAVHVARIKAKLITKIHEKLELLRRKCKVI